MHETRQDLNETGQVVESVHSICGSTSVCCKNMLMFAHRGEKQNVCGRAWLEKRKEVWVAPYTFCKLLKTVVEPASVKPPVILEVTLLFLSKFSFSLSLTSPPLQRGLYIKQCLLLTPSPGEVRAEWPSEPRWLRLGNSEPSHGTRQERS